MDVVNEMAVELRRRGFVTRAWAVGLGIRDSSFTDAAARLGLTAQFTGLWTPDEIDLALPRRAAAALEVVGQPSMLTGATALAMLGVSQPAPSSVEVVVPLGRSPVQRPGIRVHHTGTYDQIRFQHVDGLPVASARRAIADVAASAPHRLLATAIADTDRLRLCRLPAIAAEIQARKRFAGRGLLRRVVAEMQEETAHSSYERRARRLLRDAGQRPHRRPLTVVLDGSLAAEIDIPFPKAMYGVEIDGPHHLLADVAAADRIRDRRLTRAGWLIDRFFWFELDDRPAWLVAEITRQLAARSRTAR